MMMNIFQKFLQCLTSSFSRFGLMNNDINIIFVFAIQKKAWEAGEKKLSPTRLLITKAPHFLLPCTFPFNLQVFFNFIGNQIGFSWNVGLLSLWSIDDGVLNLQIIQAVLKSIFVHFLLILDSQWF